MGKNTHKTALRMPKGLHDDIIDAADKNDRTMNEEILYRLKQSFLMETENERKLNEILENTQALLNHR